jgi:hypothetical protein
MVSMLQQKQERLSTEQQHPAYVERMYGYWNRYDLQFGVGGVCLAQNEVSALINGKAN